jgi:hypothetical protein
MSIDTYAAQLPADMDSDAAPLTAEERDNAGELSLSELTSLDWDGNGAMTDAGDPESVSHDNTRRAGFAVSALEAYADRVGGLASEPVEQHMRDLLGDLHHLANALGVDFRAMLDRAEDTYQEEANGQL